MPELPEVETVVRDLRPHVVGRRIVSVQTSTHALRRRWLPAWNRLLIGRRIVEADRRGKWILLRFDDGRCLVVHLGMTGQFVVASTKQAMPPHTHLIFGLDKRTQQLRFTDIRRFGSATLFDDRAAVDGHFAKMRLGPEPFDLDVSYFRQCLSTTTRCLKAVLLDQRVVAGVGNIYAVRALFEARLPPTLLGRETTPRNARRLQKAIITVLERAIKRRGSSIRNYVGGSGLQGEMQNEFRVYGRTGEPCLCCKSSIERIRLAGRSTHFCPQCQTR